MTRRTERIAGQLRAEIARILREEAGDPRLQLVTLTRVDVAPDLSRAEVFWSHTDPRLDDESLRLVARGLVKASGFLRTRVARALDLRRTPSLHFRFDPSLDLGTRTLALLRELSDGGT